MIENNVFVFKFSNVRIGRSGRFGRKGTAINIVTDEDLKTLKQIEEFYHTSINELTEEILGAKK